MQERALSAISPEKKLKFELYSPAHIAAKDIILRIFSEYCFSDGQLNRRYFDRRVPILLKNDEQATTEVTITRDLLVCTKDYFEVNPEIRDGVEKGRSKDRTGIYYILVGIFEINKEKASKAGGYGSISDIDAVWKIDTKTSPFSISLHTKKDPELQRVIKFFFRTKQDHLDMANKEQHIGSALQTHGMWYKPNTHEIGSSLLMRKLPGMSLSTFIDLMSKNKLRISYYQALLICKAILVAYKTQIQGKAFGEQRLYHADIQPGNIMLNFQGDEITVNFIDFGLSKYDSEDCLHKPGALKYRASELVAYRIYQNERFRNLVPQPVEKFIGSEDERGQVGERTDLYSLMAVIKSFLGDTTRDKNLNIKQYHFLCQSNLVSVQSTGIVGDLPGQIIKLMNALSTSTHPDLALRNSDLDEIIKIFDDKIKLVLGDLTNIATKCESYERYINLPEADKLFLLLSPLALKFLGKNESRYKRIKDAIILLGADIFRSPIYDFIKSKNTIWHKKYISSTVYITLYYKSLQSGVPIDDLRSLLELDIDITNHEVDKLLRNIISTKEFTAYTLELFELILAKIPNSPNRTTYLSILFNDYFHNNDYKWGFFLKNRALLIESGFSIIDIQQIIESTAEHYLELRSTYSSLFNLYATDIIQNIEVSRIMGKFKEILDLNFLCYSDEHRQQHSYWLKAFEIYLKLKYFYLDPSSVKRVSRHKLHKEQSMQVNMVELESIIKELESCDHVDRFMTKVEEILAQHLHLYQVINIRVNGAVALNTSLQRR